MKVFTNLILLLLLSACSTLSVEEQHILAKRYHRYITDQQQYGVKDVWTPSLVGDCEDYALWMKEKVGGTLLQVRIKNGESHIVLKVGDKVVDSLYREVYPIHKMPHKLVITLSEKDVESLLEARRIPSN